MYTFGFLQGRIHGRNVAKIYILKYVNSKFTINAFWVFLNILIIYAYKSILVLTVSLCNRFLLQALTAADVWELVMYRAALNLEEQIFYVAKNQLPSVMEVDLMLFWLLLVCYVVLAMVILLIYSLARVFCSFF